LIDATVPPFGEIAPLSVDAVVEQFVPTIRRRLDMVDADLSKCLLPSPRIRTIDLRSKRVAWPIVNQQGLEWYGASPLDNFDFQIEDALGLHQDAKVVYDFGGHHGIWALYYSLVVGAQGRVYSFEPSIINIEVSSLLFLVNSVSNVINIGAGVAAQSKGGLSSTGILVDFVQSDDLELIDVRNIAWDRADFLKMDIEGFEYDILTNNPWVFELATNLHIELHIPHLANRGLDYRKVTALIPFDQFDVFNHGLDQPVHADTKLSGFCGLMLRRKPGVQLLQPASRAANSVPPPSSEKLQTGEGRSPIPRTRSGRLRNWYRRLPRPFRSC
jgi:FkbM family methyltransferase